MILEHSSSQMFANGERLMHSFLLTHYDICSCLFKGVSTLEYTKEFQLKIQSGRHKIC